MANKQENAVAILDNKYRNNHPIVLEDVLFGKDLSAGGSSRIECKEENADLIWSTQTHTTLVNTPLIADLFGDGNKDIIIVGTQNYIDVLRGSSGQRAIGWPFIADQSTFSSSPLLYDFDKDGINEIVVATREGEILFLHNYGIPVYNSTLKVPPLKVAKNWFTQTDKHVDASFSLHDRDNKRNAIGKKLYKEDKHAFHPNELETYKLEQRLVQKYEEYEYLYSSQFERYISRNLQYSNQSDLHIWLDAHILSTPVIADIDLDGSMELIVSASFYYDPEYYADPVNKATLDKDIDIGNYAAGGIICFGLEDMSIKWQTHLDLTSDNKLFNGYVYGSPTVIDIDNDGLMETIIGTNLGYVYILDVLGTPMHDPFSMESIYATVVAQDLNGDGKLELIVTDLNGNIVCLNNVGEEIWDYQVSGMTESPVSIGDINGDGILDVVVGTFNGLIYAFRGDNGEMLTGFPIKTKSTIMSPLLLVNLSPDRDEKGLSIVVHSSDGVLLTINTRESCTNKYDIGDNSVSMVLASDLTGDGYLDLVVNSLFGVVYTLSTNSPYTPPKERVSFNQGKNVYSFEHEGIYISRETREAPDVLGSEFTFEFDIIDHGYNMSRINSYTVTAYYGGKRLFLMNYNNPGRKSLLIPAPERSESKILTLEMKNNNGLIFTDQAAFSFNLHFSRLLKWIIVLPLAISSAIIIIQQQNLKSALPL